MPIEYKDICYIADRIRSQGFIVPQDLVDALWSGYDAINPGALDIVSYAQTIKSFETSIMLFAYKE